MINADFLRNLVNPEAVQVLVIGHTRELASGAYDQSMGIFHQEWATEAASYSLIMFNTNKNTILM